MTTKAIGSGFLALLFLSACGAGTLPAVPPSPTLAPEPPEGTWSGTITRTWSEVVNQVGDGFTSMVTEGYQAVATVSSTNVDVGAWTFVGSAAIAAKFTSDAKSHQVTSLGTCDTHYTDNASGNGTVDVEGGLEARDGFYQFTLSIPGLDTGTYKSVRDDSGCFGASVTEAHPWSIGPSSAGGDGDMTNPIEISGSKTDPRGGGADEVSWSFTFNP